MNHEESQFNNERYEINSLLSNPKPKDILWKSRLIVRLSNLASLLGLELKERNETDKT